MQTSSGLLYTCVSSGQLSASSMKLTLFLWKHWYSGLSILMNPFLQGQNNNILLCLGKQIKYPEALQQKSWNHDLRIEVIFSKYGKRDDKHGIFNNVNIVFVHMILVVLLWTPVPPLCFEFWGIFCFVFLQIRNRPRNSPHTLWPLLGTNSETTLLWLLQDENVCLVSVTCLSAVP